VIEHALDDAEGDVEALFRDEVEGVVFGVPPWGVGEVADDVEGGDAGVVEGDVVVDDGGVGWGEAVGDALVRAARRRTSTRRGGESEG